MYIGRKHGKYSFVQTIIINRTDDKITNNSTLINANNFNFVVRYNR